MTCCKGRENEPGGGHQEGTPSAWLRPRDSYAGQWEAIERAVPRSSVFYIHTTLDSPPVT